MAFLYWPLQTPLLEFLARQHQHRDVERSGHHPGRVDGGAGVQLVLVPDVEEILADLAGGRDVLAVLPASMIDRHAPAAMPSCTQTPLMLRIGGEQILHRLLALAWSQLALTSLSDLDARILGEDLAVACDAHLVGRMAGDAVDRNHIALAAQRFGEPLGRLQRPGLLVDADIDARRGDDTSASVEITRMPACLACAKTGSNAVGLFGLMMMALTPSLMKLRTCGDLARHVDVGALRHHLDVDAAACFQAAAAACASWIICVRHSLPTQPLLRPMR